MTEPSLALILAAIQRIEARLDHLIDVLAEEEEGPPATTLEGDNAGSERDQGQSLG